MFWLMPATREETAELQAVDDAGADGVGAGGAGAGLAGAGLAGGAGSAEQMAEKAMHR